METKELKEVKASGMTRLMFKSSIVEYVKLNNHLFGMGDGSGKRSTLSKIIIIGPALLVVPDPTTRTSKPFLGFVSVSSEDERMKAN